MGDNQFNFDKIKELAKDAESFEKLKGLISPLLESSGDFQNMLSSKSTCVFKGFFWTKTTFGKKGTTIFSDSIEQVTGYSATEVTNMPGKLFSIIYKDDLEETKKEYSEFINDEKRSCYELIYRIKKKNDEIIWLRESYALSRDKEGHVIECDTIASDVTDLIKDEQSMRESIQKLNDILNEKDKFINIISHDLRAPFTSLLGFSEILINEPGLPHEERMEYLEYIHDSSRMQLQFINHLLDWSRLQTGKIKVEPKRMPLKDVVSNCVSLATHDAIRKNLEIKVNVSDNLYVNAEERLLGEAISNLLNNAIKFSSDEKNIYVSANRFKEGFVEVIIKDEGIGISEENQSKLFRIDQKYIAKGTKGEKGCGMGLNLVKEIISKHNGEVWFYSEVDKGSEFHFTIPEAKSVILVVEDDVELRYLYKSILDKAMNNYKIVEANNGYEAMTQIFNQMPSLVITDHDMPMMSGIQLVEAIRKKDKRNRVPIIVISAKFDNNIKKKYEEFGVKHLISKPFGVNEMAELVKKTIQ